MNNRSILSIDLGSSYTKIAVRDDWDSRAGPVRVQTLATRDDPLLIPSTLASVRRPNGISWLFGREATVQPHALLTRFYRDWKSDLFGQNEKKQKKAAYIAKLFFQKLRASVPTEYRALEVRVGIPAFKKRQDGAELLKESLTKAGWKLASGRPVVSEPEANLWGILTRGRNKRIDYRPKSGEKDIGPQPGLIEMIDRNGGFSKALKRGIRSTDRTQFSVMVIDIGGFTTDFGLMRIDTSFALDYRKPNVDSHSVRLGVRDLDENVFEQLGSRSRAAIRKITNERWEKLKVSLYNGRSQAVREKSVPGGMVVIGDGEEREKIRGAIEAFGFEVRDALNEFRREHPKVDAHAITGGGSLIPGVMGVVRDACGGEYDGDFDLLTEEAARFQVNPHGDGTIAQVERQLDENQKVIRIAGALGGASVVLE